MNESIQFLPLRVFIHLFACLFVFKWVIGLIPWEAESKMEFNVFNIYEGVSLWSTPAEGRWRKQVWAEVEIELESRSKDNLLTEIELRGALQSYLKVGQVSQAFIFLHQLVTDGCHGKGSGLEPGDLCSETLKKGQREEGSLANTTPSGWSEASFPEGGSLQCPTVSTSWGNCILENLNHLFFLNLVSSDSRVHNPNIFVPLYILV